MAGEVCGGYGGGRKSAIALLVSDEGYKFSDERLEVAWENYFSTSDDGKIRDLDIGRCNREGKSPTLTSSDGKVKSGYDRTKCAENDQFGDFGQFRILTFDANQAGAREGVGVGAQGFDG